jgi:hypothetical protein
MAFLTQNKAKLGKNLIIGFWGKRQSFRRKLWKLAGKNCDPNIDPSFDKIQTLNRCCSRHSKLATVVSASTASQGCPV